MKKIIALLLVLAMILTCFVACGKDDKDDEDEKEEKKTTTEELDEDDKDKDKDKDNDKEPETDAPETDAPETDAPSVDVRDIAGTYSGTIDADSDLLAYMDEDVQLVFQMGMSITAIYTLNTDMTCEIHMSLEGLEDMISNLIIYSLTAAAEENGMTLEELWAQLVEEYGSEDAVYDALEEELTPALEELFGDLSETEYSTSGTYEVVGETVILSYDDNTEELVIDGDDLVVNENGLTFVLERQ